MDSERMIFRYIGRIYWDFPRCIFFQQTQSSVQQIPCKKKGKNISKEV